MIYFTSDLHLGHDQILTYEPRRQIVLGTTITEHDTNIIARINSKVKPDDVLFILGDFCLSHKNRIKTYRQQIQCRTVILVMGNHDKRLDYYECGFQTFCYEMLIRVAGDLVRLRHHPYRKPIYKTVFPWQYKEKDRNKRPKDTGHTLLHGHIHSGNHRVSKAWNVHGRQINVGVDCNKYFPISLREVESLIAKEKANNENRQRRYRPCTVIRKMKRRIRLFFLTYLTKN